MKKAMRELTHTLKMLDGWCSNDTPLCIYKDAEIMLGGFIELIIVIFLTTGYEITSSSRI